MRPAVLPLALLLACASTPAPEIVAVPEEQTPAEEASPGVPERLDRPRAGQVVVTETAAEAEAKIRKRAQRRGTEAEIAFCVEETNRYRTAIKKPPFARTAALDDFASRGAEHDAKRREPHHHFNNTQFPDSFSALAENELPWWHLDADEGAVRRVIRAGLRSMWEEGPGGGHYENLVGTYTQMGCGIWIDGNEITVVQDFRTP